MRPFIIACGVATVLLGIIGFIIAHDPAMLQGGLTLGGGWIICALFSLSADSKWHGVIGAGVLGLLGAARCVPMVFKLLGAGQPAQLYFQAAAAVLSLVTVVVAMRGIYAERARLQIAALKGGE